MLHTGKANKVVGEMFYLYEFVEKLFTTDTNVLLSSPYLTNIIWVSSALIPSEGQLP
jgi:hypothetical protein